MGGPNSTLELQVEDGTRSSERETGEREREREREGGREGGDYPVRISKILEKERERERKILE